MSLVNPRCKVCIDPQVQKIDQKFIELSGPSVVLRWMKMQMTPKGTRRGLPLYTLSVLRNHRQDCLALDPLPTGVQQKRMNEEAFGIPPQYESDTPIEGVQTKAPPPGPIHVPNDAQGRAKIVEELLYNRLADLTPKQLYDLHMAELKLATARAEHDTPDPSPTGDAEGPSDFDEEMARVAGHRPELRVVGKKKRAG